MEPLTVGQQIAGGQAVVAGVDPSTGNVTVEFFPNNQLAILQQTVTFMPGVTVAAVEGVLALLPHP